MLLKKGETAKLIYLKGTDARGIYTDHDCNRINYNNINCTINSLLSLQ